MKKIWKIIQIPNQFNPEEKVIYFKLQEWIGVETRQANTEKIIQRFRNPGIKENGD